MSIPAPKDTVWTDDASCRDLLFDEDGNLDPSAINVFFVEAGRVIDPQAAAICVTCPVRRECLQHSFTGFEGKPMPAGYFAGFSFGQRSTTSYEALLARVERESAQYRKDAQSPAR